MSNPEIKPRIIINTWIHGPVQLPERLFEHPLPKSTYGIMLSSGSKPEIDILDKEVAIYSKGFPGDPVVRRLAAVLSVEDAKTLMSQLPSMINAHYAVISHTIISQKRNFNPDNYPPVRIILEPDIVESNIDPEEIEHPFPSGSTGLSFPFAIRGISPISEEKIPMLLITKAEAINLYESLKKSLNQSCFRGNKAISVEREFVSPSRLVCFANNQFIAV